MAYASGVVLGPSVGQGFSNVSYSVVTPTEPFVINPMQMITSSDTWRVIPCPPSASKQLVLSGLSDYEISSADMLTKKTSEMRYELDSRKID